LRFKYY